jgi:DNA segregation ATPase FtsK/SpoIIIE, S-DNA-T family
MAMRLLFVKWRLIKFHFFNNISKIVRSFYNLGEVLAKTHKEVSRHHSGVQIARGLREILLLGVSTIALFFLISLVTFNLEDGGWTHSGTGQPIHNAGGEVGAWLSDFFLSLFGLTAYLFPFMIAYHGLLVYRGKRAEGHVSILALRWTGFVATIVSGAALLALHWLRIRLPMPGSTGGVLGQEVGDFLLHTFGSTGATLLLLALFFAGTTLFTGCSWIAMADWVGKYTLAGLHSVYRWAGALSRSVVERKQRRQEARTEAVVEREKKRRPVVESVDPSAAFKPADKPIEPIALLPVDRPIETEKPTVLKRPRKERSQSKLQQPAVAGEGGVPPLSLLDEPRPPTQGYSSGALEEMSRQVEVILSHFGVEVEVVAVDPGPVITRFEIEPAAGVKVSRISSLAKDLARALSVTSVRIVEIIPGKSVIGLEIPNKERELVALRDVLSSRLYAKSVSPLTLILGKDSSGEPVAADLAKMPHLLVAGTTGSGKSVAVNAMILSMLYKATPAEVRLIMVDPKMLELSVYEGIPHLLTPVVTDMKEAANALRWCVAEMERRYRVMSMVGVRNLAGFNRKVREAEQNGTPIKDPLFTLELPLEEGEEVPVLTPLPSIVIVIDELADMMMIVGKKVEELIARLAQKARAAGLHLILATQRPSVDVLTGLIKANIPSRIAFQVSSKIDSRTILDQGGAEALLGHGDMLFLPPGTSIPIRAHGAFVDDHEVHKVVEFLKQTGPANYLEEITKESGDGVEFDAAGNGADDEMDPLYDQAVRIVTETRKASISGVQRRLKVGYNRAARMVEDMERAGVVGPLEANGSREVLAPPPPEE